jgi:hypothetical protein
MEWAIARTGKSAGRTAGADLPVKRASSGEAAPAHVPPIVHEALGSPGRPLDAAARADMEPRFGHDFSKVRIHADDRAAQSARAVNALAYTVGRDVVFDAGRFSPGTRAGRQLLAHELTHVMQQQRARPSGLFGIADGGAAEAQAERAGQTLDAAGGPAFARPVPVGQFVLQRQGKAADDEPKALKLDSQYYTKVRDFLERRADKDTKELIHGIDFSKTDPQLLKTKVPGRKFFLKLTWVNRSDSQTFVETANPKTAPEVTIRSILGADFGGFKDTMEYDKGSDFGKLWDAGMHGDEKKRKDAIAMMMAETAYHELLHAQFLIGNNVSNPRDFDSEGYSDYLYSMVFTKFSDATPFAGKSKFERAKTRIPQLIGKMCDAVPDKITAASKGVLMSGAIEFLVNEKVAFWKAGKAFGLTPKPAILAHSYAKNWVQRGFLSKDLGGAIYDNMTQTNKYFGEAASDLDHEIANLYEVLDQVIFAPGKKPEDFMTQMQPLPLPKN